jgi:hypothetical protein
VFCPYPSRSTIPIAAYPPEPTAVCRPTLLSLRQRTHLSRHNTCVSVKKKESLLDVGEWRHVFSNLAEDLVVEWRNVFPRLAEDVVVAVSGHGLVKQEDDK